MFGKIFEGNARPTFEPAHLGPHRAFYQMRSENGRLQPNDSAMVSTLDVPLLTRVYLVLLFLLPGIAMPEEPGRRQDYVFAAWLTIHSKVMISQG